MNSGYVHNARNKFANLINNNQGARNGSPSSTKLNGSLMGAADVMPDGPTIKNNKNSGFKSAQRSTNFIRAGNSISGSINNDHDARHKSNAKASHKQFHSPNLNH